MADGHDPRRRPPRLASLGQQITRWAEDAEAERELAELEPAADSEHADRAAQRQHRAPTPGRRWRARRRLVPIGAVLVAAIVAVALAVLGRGTSRALAAPSQAAVAAEHAGSFAFSTISELTEATAPKRTSTTEGAVDLQGAGAFKVRVLTQAGVGFERLAFPTALYTRRVSPRRDFPWVGVELSPPARITAHTASGGGLGDPLKFIALLATQHGDRRGSLQVVDKQLTRHYTLTLTLGAFLTAHTPASRAVRATPVEIGVWQNANQQLVRAVRRFKIGGPGHRGLRVETNFGAYGAPVRITAPEVPLSGSQPLNPTADDPLGASVLGALAAGTGHGATAAASPSPITGTPGTQAPGRGPRP